MDTLTLILRGVFGLVVLLGFCWAFSANRKAINWRLVGGGVLLQVGLAGLVLKVNVASRAFDAVANFFTGVLAYSGAGAQFLFGGLGIPSGSAGFVFAFQILPTILFFSALSALLYHWKILPLIVKAFAWVMGKTMKLSGAESLCASANIFLGQTEAPLLIKPYIEKMSRSEVLVMMTAGMATIAGGVFASYIGFLGGDDPVKRLLFAKHLLTASVLSAPAAIVCAKMLFPETEKVDATLNMETPPIGVNAFDAIMTGTGDGLKLALNVGAALLVSVALVAMVNGILTDWIGTFSWNGTTLNDHVKAASGGVFSALSMEAIMGYLFAAVAWVIGVGDGSILMVGQLLGQKLVLNEYVAYASLRDLIQSGKLTDQRAIILATYALCGFSNFGSIGIQIGGIGALAPSQRGNLARLAVRALAGATVACLMTAIVAGFFT